MTVTTLRLARSLLAVACLAGLALPASAIEGRYRVEGSNPGKPEATYRGRAEIRKSGETYSIVWEIGRSRQIGTGLLTGDVLSIVFRSVEGAGGGVASFAVRDGAVAGGAWAATGATVAGTEHWTIEP